jgi:transcription initiation factor TFIIIB Brf1 subunit/transcription initiation factor TFIIB
MTGIVAPNPLPDATDPTVACARCDSTEVFMTDGGPLVCAKCGTILDLEITEIAPG